jgi:hypothetical protein
LKQGGSLTVGQCQNLQGQNEVDVATRTRRCQDFDGAGSTDKGRGEQPYSQAGDYSAWPITYWCEAGELQLPHRKMHNISWWDREGRTCRPSNKCPGLGLIGYGILR